MADGNITVEVSTQAAREEIDRLREELACVRQALPELWRDSELSVAVSTLAAENDLLKREAHTWSKAAETYAAEAERLRAALRQLVDVEEMRLRLRQLHEMGHGTDYTDYHRLLPMAWAAAREALGPNAESTGPRRP
ncbi:MAG: hypothetical protein KDF67_10525 [Ottowia sp.]|nr:hypothetical protein [Ottowia sp.]